MCLCHLRNIGGCRCSRGTHRNKHILSGRRPGLRLGYGSVGVSNATLADDISLSGIESVFPRLGQTHHRRIFERKCQSRTDSQHMAPSPVCQLHLSDSDKDDSAYMLPKARSTRSSRGSGCCFGMPGRCARSTRRGLRPWLPGRAHYSAR